MKVQCDAEKAIEHLLKAVKSMCAADMIAQRALVKGHASQGQVERSVQSRAFRCERKDER